MIRRAPGALAAFALVLTASACGSGTPQAGASGSPAVSPSPSVSPYATVPTGVTLTTPGTQLGLGDDAVIAWHPRQDGSAPVVLDVRLTRIERTTFDKSFQGWNVSSSQAATTPYFVRAVVTNESDTTLSALPVPIWAQQDSGTLVAAQPFDKRVFQPCHPSSTPATLAPGARANMCFVYLVSPGQDLAAVTFQPQTDTGAALAAITWTGRVSTSVKSPAPKPTKKPRKTQKR